MASIDTDTTVCAACGKEGGNLNTCNKCKMVKYCNAACKKKHRSKHKKQCERRVAELNDEALFKEPPPPDDCPICFLPLPHDKRQITFKSCCGKLICAGCIHAIMGESRGRGKIGLCPFCREPKPSSDAERIKRMEKLMECCNAYALNTFAGYYEHGVRGMPQDFAKANELHFKSGELGCADAYCNLGNSYMAGEGVELDKKKANHYWELAAMAGDVIARHNLGCDELNVGNYDRAYKHFILSAKAGHKISLDVVKEGFKVGLVTKDEFANTLRAYQSQQDEMKSDARDKARAHINGNAVMRV